MLKTLDITERRLIKGAAHAAELHQLDSDFPYTSNIVLSLNKGKSIRYSENQQGRVDKVNKMKSRNYCYVVQGAVTMKISLCLMVLCMFHLGSIHAQDTDAELDAAKGPSLTSIDRALAGLPVKPRTTINQNHHRTQPKPTKQEKRNGAKEREIMKEKKTK